jgi:hypothetical protein
MADLAGVLATGGIALVSAAAGAGLTYWLGALNRRHQEAREDDTRWYNARFQAYVDLLGMVAQCQVLWVYPTRTVEGHRELALSLRAALGSVELVGSDEVIDVANKLTVTMLRDMADYAEAVINETPIVAETDVNRLARSETLIRQLVAVARKDLGRP